MPLVKLFSEFTGELGVGINWATGDLRQTAIEKIDERVVDGSGAKKATYKLYLAEDWGSISRSETQASRASLGFGIFSGAAEVSNRLLAKSSTYGVRLVVEIDVLLAPRRLYQPSTSVKHDSIPQFVAMYGSHFINMKQKGGTLLAVLTLRTNSDEESRQIVAGANASGRLGEAEFNGAVSLISRIERIFGSRSLTIAIEPFGPPFQIHSEDWRTVIQAADQFIGSANEDNCFVRNIWVEQYDMVAGIGEAGPKLRQAVYAQQLALDRLAMRLDKLRYNLAIAQEVIANPSEFTDADTEAMGTAAEILSDRIDLCKSEAEHAQTDIEYMPVLPEIPPFKKPERTGRPTPPLPIPALVEFIGYTGRSKTGQAYRFSASSNFPQELNDKIQSFEIVGDFELNAYWITLFYHGNQTAPIQTFIGKTEVPVVDASGERTYRTYDINQAKDVDLRLDGRLVETSSIRIEANPDPTRALLPPRFRV